MKVREACTKYDVKLVLYYSHVKDWHHKDASQGKQTSESTFFPSDLVQMSEDRQAYWDEVVYPQVTELCEDYQPDGFWFDTPSDLDKDSYAIALQELVHSYLPKCVINGRLGSEP